MRQDGSVFYKSIFDGEWKTLKETKAFEAPEDITATTNDMMRRAGGRQADPGNFEPSRTSEETRQEDGGNVNRDNISGQVENVEPDNAPTTPGDTGADIDGDAGGGDDLGLDDLGGGDDTSGNNDMGGDGDDFGGGDTGMDDGSVKKEKPEDAINILNLQKNMNQFYHSLVNTLDNLTSYNSPASTPELKKIYSSSVTNLTECKNMIFQLLSTDFTSGNYAYKLRRYIALRHVYSTVLEVLNLHFKVLKEEVSNKNPT